MNIGGVGASGGAFYQPSVAGVQKAVQQESKALQAIAENPTSSQAHVDALVGKHVLSANVVALQAVQELSDSVLELLA